MVVSCLIQALETLVDTTQQLLTEEMAEHDTQAAIGEAATRLSLLCDAVLNPTSDEVCCDVYKTTHYL